MRIGLAVLLVFLLRASSFAQYEGYIWPTDASPYLSATFGETRAAHFHSGLDIKTWGREGYQVFAAKEGWVSRLAITAKGYGRVIYLKHNDGSYTVYAHLQRFNDELQTYIDSIRLEKLVFEIDIQPEEDRFTFSRGEVIGFTGSTGIGPPHLHFEIRDQYNEPVNALTSNLAIQDTIAPVISSLLVVPLSDSTSIDGSKFPRLFYPTKEHTGAYTFSEISITGPVGFAISNFDEANNVPNKYAVFDAGIIQAQDTIFFTKMDAFNFESAATMFLERISAMGAERRSYQTFYSPDAASIPFHDKPLYAFNPTDSLSNLQIFLRDFNGNKSTATVLLVKDRSEPELSDDIGPAYSWFWANNWVTKLNNSTENLVDLPGYKWRAPGNESIDELFSDPVFYSRIDPSNAYQLITQNRVLNAYFPAHTFFDTLTTMTTTGALDNLPYFAIHPASAPVRNKYRVEFYLDTLFASGQNYQLFWINRPRNELTYVPSRLVGKTLHAQPDVIGEFVALPDNEAPVLLNAEFNETSYGKWLFSITAKDELSGVDYQRSEIQINGVRAITEYDFEEELLIYYHPDFIPQQENRIEVIVYDNAGNSVFKTYQM